VVITQQGKQADLLNSAGSGYLQFINTVSETVSSSTGGGEPIFLPAGMTSDASGTTLYIATDESYVALCDATNGKVTKQILVSPSITTPMYLGQPAVTPNGQYLYVPYGYNGTTNELQNQVAMFDVGTGKMVGSPIAVGAYPVWLQMAPNGDRLYVANENANTVTVIDTAPQ
jgi:DNA-binding beta-propeller fold protein YncE